MKKIFLFFIAFVALISCNEEDGINLGHLPRTELDISKIIEITYTNGDPSAYKTSVFNDRRKKIDSFYNGDKQLLYYVKWVYNRDTVLTRIEQYDSLSVLIPEKTKKFYYDHQKRIDTIIYNSGTVAYHYDAENLIIGGVTTSAVKDSIYLNSQQHIYKVSNGFFKTAVEFDGNKITSLKTTDLNAAIDTLNVRYSYNTVIQSKGYLASNSYQKTFSNLNNAVLYLTLLKSSAIYSALYPAFINRNGNRTEITYIVDDNDYLKEANMSENGDFRMKRYYFFE